jgi:hypothetical protein
MAQKKTSPSLISLAGSGASASGLKQPDLFGQLPSVNRTPSAKPSSESTGPMSRSTTTLEPLMQMDIEELTSSAAAFRVNRGPQPGSSEAQKMTATSGRSWLPLLQTYGLNGSLAKMCEALLTSRWASRAAFLTWKASATAPSHLLFQLAPLMPRTEGIASGLWPTPAAHEARLGYQDRTRGKKGTQKSLTTEVIDDMGGRQATIGQLNPTWVGWLMGFPTGWTDLKPSEMPSSRKSSRKSDAQSSRQRARDVR